MVTNLASEPFKFHETLTQAEDRAVRGVLERITGRWSLSVLRILAEVNGPLRFSRVLERVEGISQKVLTHTLRALERDGLLTRTLYPQVPPRVEYELTPLGRLSGGLQANFGMLVTPEGGELLELPQLPVDTNGIERTAKMALDDKGTLRGDVHEVRLGDRAAAQRYELRSTTQDTDRIRPVEAVVGASFSTFQILKATVANLRVADRPFEWNYTLEADNFAKTAGDLLLVRPRVLGSKSSSLLETKEPRQYPIEFAGPERDTDVFEIALPPGYQMEELPPPVNVDDGFASYHSRTEIVGGVLRYTRTFEIKDLSVPVSKAEQLRDFYRIIAGDERNSAVLKRVPP